MHSRNSSIPNPPKVTINPLEKLMYNFYGMRNRKKNKKETIIQDYEYGGQKMVDIETFIRSLKVGLVKR